MAKKEEASKQKAEAAEEQTVADEQTAAESEEVQNDASEAACSKEEWAALCAAAEDFKRKWYAVSAEYDNYRKRTALTRSQAYSEGRADVVGKLFPIADNLERALSSCADEATKKGVEMVLKSFSKLLEEEKIETICPLGEEFDAEKCEAIMAVEPEEGEASGIVKQVYLKGYEQNGKVLRFAQVVVTK